MAIHKLAAIIKNPLNEDEFLLVKESPPPKFGEEEYDSYFDSDLWDLPSTQLNLLQGESQCGVSVEGAESVLDKIDLTKFDLNLALNQVALITEFKFTEKYMFFEMENCDLVSIMHKFNLTSPLPGSFSSLTLPNCIFTASILLFIYFLMLFYFLFKFIFLIYYIYAI